MGGRTASLGGTVLRPHLDRKVIGLVWIGGVVLMAAIYAIGPQNFLAECEAFVRSLAQLIDNLLTTLMWRAFEGMRAAAIALYAVFLALSVLGIRRGLRVGGMLVGVSIVFLLLVRTDWYDPATKWLAAALVAAVAAAAATRRLLHVPPARDPADPWRFGRS
jgi:hypothetical protein